MQTTVKSRFSECQSLTVHAVSFSIKLPSLRLRHRWRCRRSIKARPVHPTRRGKSWVMTSLRQVARASWAITLKRERPILFMPLNGTRYNERSPNFHRQWIKSKFKFVVYDRRMYLLRFKILHLFDQESVLKPRLFSWTKITNKLKISTSARNGRFPTSFARRDIPARRLPFFPLTHPRVTLQNDPRDPFRPVSISQRENKRRTDRLVIYLLAGCCFVRVYFRTVRAPVIFYAPSPRASVIKDVNPRTLVRFRIQGVQRTNRRIGLLPPSWNESGPWHYSSCSLQALDLSLNVASLTSPVVTVFKKRQKTNDGSYDEENRWQLSVG